MFVSDFVATVKICQADLFMMYVDPATSFQKLHFQHFCDIVDDYSYTITHEWVTDLNDGCESLAFRIADHTYTAHSLCSASGNKVPVSRPTFDTAVISVKRQCREAVELLITELDRRFPNSEVMNAFAIVFPQFWLQSTCDELFPLHMSTLRAHFVVVGFVNRGSVEEPRIVQIDPLLDARTLSLQTSLFKLTMKSNAWSAMEEPWDKNPMSKLWQKVGQNALMLNRLFEFIKLNTIFIILRGSGPLKIIFSI